VSQRELRTLTPREAEVLHLIAHGLANSQVAKELDVTIHAVKFHLASIYRKLGVMNRTEAAGLFFQHLAPLPVGPAASANGKRSEEENERRRRALSTPPVLDLTFAAVEDGRGAGRGRVEVSFGGELTGAVLAYAAVEHVDVGTLVLSAFGALLHRYTGVPELVLRGASGRLWIDAGGEPSFAELVRRVHCELAAGPGPEHAAGDGRLQVAFAAGAAGPGCDLEVTVEERLDGLVAVASFDRGVFAPEAVEQLLSRLPLLLRDAVEDRGRPIASLSLLSAEERVLMLEDWNDTTHPFPTCRADELIAAQARGRAVETAVEFEGEQLTYGELEARANGLARLLQSVGVGPDVLVAICVERSLDMLVGLVGIMRAGGAYVPVDPAFPADRRRFMLEDAGVSVVVTQESLLAQLDFAGPHVVCLDRDAATIAAAGSTPPPCAATADSLAYVIYTSGSTGKPKGVQIPHRALVNFLTTMAREPGMESGDVLVAVTTLSFDIAGLELYLPLASGARVVIAPQAVASDPRRLANLIERSGATVVQATPTTWRMLVDSGWPGRSRLKALCGGEALPAVLAEQLLDLGLELWNMYGPTETTIWSAISRVRPGFPLTIGRPIANTTLYILDDGMQPVPVGLAGELHIGGDGLAGGYLKRPELTAERFVRHPFDAHEDARVYKTGDLARYRADGTVDFLGRRDHQVKIRGFRIELGEIETALARQPGVTAAVAVAREDEPGDARLVAYVVLSPDDPVTPNALRRSLADVLPDYMIPSAIVVLDDLPLTPNGKIDRKTLPAPTLERDAESTYAAPRTALEQRLVGIWEQELAISPIGVTDDFFDLRLTSLVSARLFARLERELGTNLPLGALFQAPTIESLAPLIESESTRHRWTSLVPIQPAGSLPPIFCVHGGAGTILHLQPLARRLGPDQPLYGLQARGLYGGAPPHRRVEEMAAHYLDELREVQPHGPYYLSGYCFGSIVAFEMAQRLLRDGEDVHLLAAFNGPSPSWIRKYGSIRGQPSKRGSVSSPAGARPLLDRVVGVLTSRAKIRQWVRHLAWRFRNRIVDRLRVRIAVQLKRPLPEEIREVYFLEICAQAERAYEPSVYPGPMVVFCSEGVYEDPALGWTDTVDSVQTYAIPGRHRGNRTLMAEPAAGLLAEQMQDVLARARAGALRAHRAPKPSTGPALTEAREATARATRQT
jgi:amino acid adenylation domain-containing protein